MFGKSDGFMPDWIVTRYSPVEDSGNPVEGGSNCQHFTQEFGLVPGIAWVSNACSTFPSGA